MPIRDRLIGNGAPEAPTILFGANSSWNLLNFRMPLIAAIQDRGYRVAAAVPADEQAPALQSLGVEVHELAIDSRGMSALRDVHLCAGFLKLMRETRPSLYLGFTAKPNIYGSLAASLLGIPTIATITGLGTSFLSGSPLQAVVSALYRVALRKCDRVFFHNPEDLELFVRRSIVGDHVAAVVPGSGVDVAHFAPRDRSGDDLTFTFLFIGRMLKDKGALEFAQAAAILRPSSGARFAMLGSFEDHPRSVPRQIMEGFAADGSVEFLGTAADVRPHIAAADCVVLPSYREGLPRAILEASAMARPVIASDVPGCRQAVDHLLTGYLCRPCSSSSLARAMEEMMAMTAEERRAMGLRGRQKVRSEFSEGHVVSAYLEVLDRIGLRGRRQFD